MAPEMPVSPTPRPALFAVALLAACGGATEPAAHPGADSGADRDAPFEELYAQGMDRYVGRYQPAATEALPGGVLMHSFVGDDGPLCFTGQPFHMSTRDGAGDVLMVFLQGGGACGPTHCEATESWPPGIPGPVQAIGVLNAGDPTNPVADFDLAYLPYCDGSMWSGDAEVDNDGDGRTDHHFRGLMNLTASIDVTAAAYPSPRRILLIGNSAGGFGTHHALPLLRIHYPDVPIDLINDSGVGISAPGLQAAANEHWGAGGVYPESCADCLGADGHLTGYHRYQLDRDPRLQMGMMSFKQDGVVLERLPLSPEAWEAALLASMDELETAHPDRFRSFIADGDGHTFVIRDYDRAVGGTTPRAWLADLLGAGPWVSVSD